MINTIAQRGALATEALGWQMLRPRPSGALFALAMLAAFCPLAWSAEAEAEEKPRVEFSSPDRRFAFRYTPESEKEAKAYDLIDKRSGAVLTRVAEFDSDYGASARFQMVVMWRPDSKAFALTVTLWKRGSQLSVYQRDGDAFRKVELPELLAEIPDKARKGKSFPHVVEEDSQSAKQWRRDGSLVVKIESIEDGNDGSVTARRTVVLGFGSPGKAKILKSTIKITMKAP